MKYPKKLIFGAIFALFVAVMAGASAIYATVGGPTVVSEFKYNPADESVYYIEHSQDGRGCPPVLKKLSLNTGEHATVFSCEEGFELFREQGESYDSNLIYSKLSEMMEGFKNLSTINLKKNDIEVDVDFVREERFDDSDNSVIRRHFTASVYQGGEEVAEFPVTGCSTEQPFLFSGYAIPGFEQRIVMLVSAKSDCFEGGYIGESLHNVSGVSDLDRSHVANSYKGLSPLLPSEATLVVFESEGINTQNSKGSLTGEDQDFSGLKPGGTLDGFVIYALISIISLAAGSGIGFFVVRRKVAK